jgi:hypothetical protein
MPEVLLPYPGMRTWLTPWGARVLRLHYEADPAKGRGEKVFVPDVNMHLSPWAKAEYDRMTDKSLYKQEYEIDFAARLGQLLFQLDEEASVCDSFLIPHSWTRYYALDPHPRVPHAHLWCAVDPFGDRWYYREFWPSKIYGKPGDIPEDDNRFTIREHCQVVQYLEGEENPDNQGEAEYIRKRIIDYAARSMGTLWQSDDRDKEPQENYQERFEREARDLGFRLNFEDAKKDRSTGIDRVNLALKPLQVEKNGKFVKSSRAHIFRDKCPELLWQLRNNRWTQLTPEQQTKMDPSSKAVLKRNHKTDLMRYVEMADPVYVERKPKVGDDWEPLHGGVNY